MTDSEKKVIIVLVIITAIVIGVVLLLPKNKGNAGEVATGTEVENQEEPEEEFVNLLEDGTKLNNSEALQKTKTVGGLEISDLQLTEKGNETVLLGTVKNNTNTEQTRVINITLIDKDGKELTALSAYIEGIKPGESKQLIVSTTLDYANAYDFKVSE